MKFFTVLVFFISLFIVPAQGQSFIGKKKSEINIISNKVSKPTLIFDENKICIREIYDLSNLSACNKLVEEMLKDTSYGWIRINENQVVSNFINQRLIEVLETNKGCRIQIHQTAWTKELYELLLNR